MFLFCLVFAMSLCASVYMCFVVTCWERADLMALVCGVYCEFVTFPFVSWVLIFAPLLTLNVYNYVHTDCLRHSGGASIFVKSSFPQIKFDLQTELQATAVSVTLDREITICSVYIFPSFSLNSQHLDNLLQQLPSPYILLGNFNVYNILWGGQNIDSIGELVENFITTNDICIMNDKSYTYHSPSTKSFTSIDLSFYHPSLFLDYNWSVCEDQHNSDHFPIIIEQN